MFEWMIAVFLLFQRCLPYLSVYCQNGLHGCKVRFKHTNTGTHTWATQLRSQQLVSFVIVHCIIYFCIFTKQFGRTIFKNSKSFIIKFIYLQKIFKFSIYIKRQVMSAVSVQQCNTYSCFLLQFIFVLCLKCKCICICMDLPYSSFVVCVQCIYALICISIICFVRWYLMFIYVFIHLCFLFCFYIVFIRQIRSPYIFDEYTHKTTTTITIRQSYLSKM